MDGVLQTRYWLDANDWIIKVCGNWDQFAQENNGEDAVASKVVGHRLWEFITEDSTCMWMSTLLALARISRERVARKYRCDSPFEKRFLNMKIIPEAAGQLCLEHNLLKKEKLTHAIYYQSIESEDDRYPERCSICNRIKINGRWEEGEAALKEGKISRQGIIAVRYTLCPDCYARMFQFQASLAI